MITIEQLKGVYGSYLASKHAWRLRHELRIDAHGGYSSWFTVEHLPTGKVREFPGLAAAIRAYNEEGKETGKEISRWPNRTIHPEDLERIKREGR